MCEYLFAFLIINAIETTPGVMRVELLKYHTVEHTLTEIIHVPTQEYLDCWDGQR